jgi:hypothetical protein
VQSRILDFAVTLASIVAVVVTGDLFLSANFGSFENPHLTPFHRLLPVWLVLEFVPGIVIGLLVRRNSKRISAVAYSLGVLINYYRFDGYGIAHQVPIPWSIYFRIMIYNIAIAAFLGAALALIGQSVYSLTIGSNDRGTRFR